MAQLIISSAEESDLGHILTLQRKAYQSEAALYADYSIPPLRQTLEDLRVEAQTKIILKACVGQKILGSVRLSLSGTTCHLGRLIVDPAAQGEGIGSALLAAADSVFPEARTVELFTGSKSLQNLRFYEKRGYVRTHEQMLSTNVTLVYLRKSLRQLSSPSG